MEYFKKYEVGKLQDLNEHVFAPEGVPIRLEGKVFLKALLGLTSVEVSLNKDEPGTGMHFFHRHIRNEETYIFIGGEGEMMIDNERFKIKEGTVVRVLPNALRAWWNTGKEALYYVVIQAPADALEAGTHSDGELVEGKVPWV